MPGYIRQYRDELDEGWFSGTPYDPRAAFIDLKSLANFKDDKIIVRGKVIEIKAGEVGWAQENLARRWQRSRDWVKTFLKNFEELGKIRLHKTPVFTKIEILPYRDKLTSDQHENNIKSDTKYIDTKYSGNGDNGKKGEDKALSDEEIESLKNGFPSLDVDTIYRRYLINCKRKNKDPLYEELELWLESDLKHGQNARISHDKKLEMIYCPTGCGKKEVLGGPSYKHLCDKCGCGLEDQTQLLLKGKDADWFSKVENFPNSEVKSEK